jgi:hypothetical protein
MHPTEHYVRTVLAPFHDALCGMYDRAWEHYGKIPDDIRAIVNQEPRAVANVIWTLVNHEATKYFYPLNISPRPVHNTNVFAMPGGKVVLRFKKTDSTGATSNYPTPRAVSFDAGAFVLDTPEPLRVAVGWVPNAARTGYSDVLISLRGPVTWRYSILSGGSEMGLFDNAPTDDSRPIIRPRGDEGAAHGDEAVGD